MPDGPFRPQRINVLEIQFSQFLVSENTKYINPEAIDTMISTLQFTLKSANIEKRKFSRKPPFITAKILNITRNYKTCIK